MTIVHGAIIVLFAKKNKMMAMLSLFFSQHNFFFKNDKQHVLFIVFVPMFLQDNIRGGR
jgi:hypothetical protein